MRHQTNKTVLVVGASGATGRLLVEQLLDAGANIRAIVRSPDGIHKTLRNHPRLSITHATLLDLGADELIQLTHSCDAVASCLGHNLSLKGLFGPPYRLVTEATRRLSAAISAQERETPVRFVLMNTAGNSNRDIDEPVPFAQRLVIGLLRVAVPPHADNEHAANFLRRHVGRDDSALEWCVVRPDTLTDEPEVTECEVYPSPTRSAIFDPGTTSRINVARFMADLIVDDETWSRWKGHMPTIYNKA
jgi:nucleoside-diphosphate-sugar epimerase